MTIALQVHAAGSFQNTNVEAHAGGAWQQVQTVFVHAAGSWQTVWVNFTAHNTMVAGNVVAFVGYANSTFDPPGYGTLSPGTDAHGYQIVECGVQNGVGLEYWLNSGSSLGQSYFTTFQIYGSDIGLISLASSAATYSFSSPYSVWKWSSVAYPTLTSGNSYGIATS